MIKMITTRRLSSILLAPSMIVAIWILELYKSSEIYGGNNHQQVTAISARPKRETASSRTQSKTLRQLISSSPANPSRCQEHQAQTVWISPYRQFPEVVPEGNSRGQGDYEYLSLFGSGSCSHYKLNYGAFKNSPADIVFSKASAAGLSEELETAKRLGYTWFALDLNKVWLRSWEIESTCKKSEHCQVTSDNFVAISIDKPNAANDFAKSLKSATRRLSTKTTTLLSENLIYHSSSWHGIEAQSDGSAIAWSKTSRRGDLVELAGKRTSQVPINVDTIIVPASSIKSITLDFLCQDGGKKRLSGITAPLSIGSLLHSCQPDAIQVADFGNGKPGAADKKRLKKIPPLGVSDSRLSVFALMVVER